jgi:RimJ/RimL family protein N-acetyltransferase
VTFPLLTARLAIRPLTAADGADLYAVFAAPDVMRFWNSAPPASLEEAGEWAAHMAGLHRRLGYAQWHVSERGSGRLVGIAGLQPLDGGPEVEVTYALEPSAWGKGFATEAALAALEYGFAQAGLKRVVGIVREANAASVEILRKLGMRSLGVAEYWGKEWAKYEVTAAEWRAEQEAARLPLGTDRLELRRFTAADLEPLQTVFCDPEVMRFVGAERRPLSAGEVVAWLARVEEHWQAHAFGPLAVVERASGRVIGEAGLQLLEAGPDVELTYTLARTAWNHGFAMEAARAVLVWGFAGLRLQRIWAVDHPENAPSRRVLEKLGMTARGSRDCYGARLAGCALTLGEWRGVVAGSVN